jgi:hypothetical protein
VGECFSVIFFNNAFIRLYRTVVPQEINTPMLIDNGASSQVLFLNSSVLFATVRHQKSMHRCE